MPDEVPTNPKPGAPAAHWGTKNPEEQPPRELVLGLPRMVIEAHTRLGPDATPEQVVRDLQAGGVETTVEEVRSLWPEGGKLTG